ncbi:MAG: hypothetical protein ASARMPRED_005878 [Alectoria sarmentosa]|nr:MAG: hypothetical protein ASARMPRED_005878 [Alectoria sarmentosa]
MLVSPSIKALAALFLYKYIHFEVLCATHELARARTTDQLPDLTLPSPQKPNRLLETLIRYPDFGTKTVALSLDVHKPNWLLHFPLGKLLKELPALRELSFSPPPMYWAPLEDLQNLTSVQLDFHRAIYDDCSQGDGLFMARGVPLHIVARYLSLPSLRRLQAKKIYFALGCDHQQYLNKTREQHGGSSVDDLRFLGCDAYGTDGDSLVAGFISSARRLKRFVFEMNGVGEVSLAEQFKAIGRALMTHYATLDEVVLAESDTILFTRWTMASLKGCGSIRRLAIPIRTNFGDLDVGSGFETYPSLHKYIPPQLEELQIQFSVGVSELDG